MSVTARTFAMDWETAARLPWGILILFGRGLSRAGAIPANGVDRFIGGGFTALTGMPVVLMVLAVALVVIFLTELTSNTAVTTTLMPAARVESLGRRHALSVPRDGSVHRAPGRVE